MGREGAEEIDSYVAKRFLRHGGEIIFSSSLRRSTAGSTAVEKSTRCHGRRLAESSAPAWPAQLRRVIRPLIVDGAIIFRGSVSKSCLWGDLSRVVARFRVH